MENPNSNSHPLFFHATVSRVIMPLHYALIFKSFRATWADSFHYIMKSYVFLDCFLCSYGGRDRIVAGSRRPRATGKDRMIIGFQQERGELQEGQ